MSDIKLEDNDILFKDNDIVLITNEEETAQRLNIKIVALIDDWFLDINYGTDWLGLLSNRVSKDLLDANIKKIILGDKGVSGISSYRSTVSNSKLNVRVIVTSKDNEEIIVEVEL